MFHAEQTQDRRVDIVRDRVRRAQARFISGTVDAAATNAGAGHPT